MADPLDPAAFRDACSRFATGVCVVTARGPDGPSGMTANAVSSLSLVPPLMVVCFALTARTLAAVRHSGRFAVHFLSHEQEDVAGRFASKLPEAEKFQGVPHTVHDGIPVLQDALAWVGCALDRLTPGGDHTIGIGAVRAAEAGNRHDPLIWFRGGYGGLA